MSKTLFSIVVPIYFNEKNIPVTYPRLKKLEKSIENVELELIFVDDGSKDNSYEELLKIKKQDPSVKIVKLARNFGSFNAILAGLALATGDCVGIISADLQDPPELFKDMIEEWRNEKKVVMAVRKDRHDPWLSKTLSNMFYKLLRKYAIPTMPEGGFDFVLLDKQVVPILNSINEKNSSVMAVIAWLGFDSTQIPYTRKQREIGESKWTFSKKFKLFVDMFTSYSYFPIRLISMLGIIIAFASFIYAAILIYLRIFNNIQVEGWTTLTVIVLFMSSFQLIALGIIGEYLWRNFDEAKKRPNYIVEEVV